MIEAKSTESEEKVAERKRLAEKHKGAGLGVP